MMRKSLVRRVLLLAGALVLVGAGGMLLLYRLYPNQVSNLAGLTRSYILSWNAPPGTISTEANPAYNRAGSAAPAPAVAASSPTATVDDWPSYNRTLTSNRFSELRQIDRTNVAKLKILCTYDTNQYTSFESGLIMANGALIGTTEFDIFSLDPATCKERWRTHESYPASLLAVNRGAAYLDGRLFRGTQDGRVLAYDFDTGKRVWETTIADTKLGESVPAAPITWNGLVLVGNAGGDYKGGKGRMYALDARSGKIVWEFFLVPKAPGEVARGPQGATPLDISTWANAPGIPISGGGTWTSSTLDPETGQVYVPGGNPAPDFSLGSRMGENLYSGSVVVLDARTGDYRKHYKIVLKDWHDWDVSNPPVLIGTTGGRRLLSVAPKDGHLYGFDLATDELLYRVPVTRIENAEVPFEVGKPVRFCPGPVGGAEWSSPAYDPQTNLVLVGTVEWCFTVTLEDDRELRLAPVGQPWSGMATWDPFFMFGRPARADGNWAGWVHAVDADTGVWAWRLKSNYPVLGGMTATAGGLVLFGDVGGTFYALDAANGQRLWGQKIGGAIGGGVITYTAGGRQLIAVAAGFTSIAWPTEITTGKVVVLGLDGASP